MEKYIDLLTKLSLFENIRQDDIPSALNCLNAKISSYKKGQFILMEGNKVDFIAIITKGNVHLLKNDYDGNRTIISNLKVGDFFAEALCLAEVNHSPVSVICNTDVEIIKLSILSILNTTPPCQFHSIIMANMLHIIAIKNINLQERIEIVSGRTLRIKIMNYLKSLSIKQGEHIFIPFNREEFADFLAVERTSLSHELSRMKQDGMIEYHKSHFRILK